MCPHLILRIPHSPWCGWWHSLSIKCSVFPLSRPLVSHGVKPSPRAADAVCGQCLHPVALSVAIALIGGNWPGLATGTIIECTDNEHDTTFRRVRSGGDGAARLFGVVREGAISRGGDKPHRSSLLADTPSKARLALSVVWPFEPLTSWVAGPEPATEGGKNQPYEAEPVFEGGPPRRTRHLVAFSPLSLLVMGP